MAINAGTRKPKTTGPANLNDNGENYPAVGVAAPLHLSTPTWPRPPKTG